MSLPKTIDLPLGELDRAKTVEDVKVVLKKFMLEIRTTHEQTYAALEKKEDA